MANNLFLIGQNVKSLQDGSITHGLLNSSSEDNPKIMRNSHYQIILIIIEEQLCCCFRQR
jgi:hypothetical protein